MRQQRPAVQKKQGFMVKNRLPLTTPVNIYNHRSILKTKKRHNEKI